MTEKRLRELRVLWMFLLIAITIASWRIRGFQMVVIAFGATMLGVVCSGKRVSPFSSFIYEIVVEKRNSASELFLGLTIYLILSLGVSLIFIVLFARLFPQETRFAVFVFFAFMFFFGNNHPFSKFTNLSDNI